MDFLPRCQDLKSGPDAVQQALKYQLGYLLNPSHHVSIRQG